MRKQIISLIFLISFINIVFGQQKYLDEIKQNTTNSIILTNSIQKEQIKLKHLSKQLDEHKKTIKELEKTIITSDNNVKNALKEVLNIYVFFIGLILTIIAAAINFFGKSAIKKRVEEIIQNTAVNFAEQKTTEILTSKLTDELISNKIKENGEPEIRKIISELNLEGKNAIQSIKNKGDEVINSVLSKPESNKTIKSISEKTDEQIKDNNEINRIDEFFDMALNSKDSSIQVSLYENILKIEPTNRAALNNISAALNDLSNYNLAIEYLNKLIGLYPDYGLAYANRAYSYNQLNKYNESIEDVNTAIKLHPEIEWPYSIKGNILTKIGKFEEANEILNKAIEINSNSAVAFFNRGYFYEETKKHEKSIDDYNKAIELGHPNLPMVYNNLAVAYRRLKQYDRAIYFLNKAREINPDYANLDGTLALIYADKNQPEQFYEHIKKALDKGCKVWNYLNDPAFDKFKEQKRLKELIEPYQKNEK